jgi:uncharacterized repeat protein (TIGR03809 family)
MTHQIDVARGRDTVARWCALAEQRLEYLTELFETGRWRRFHSELAFLENIQEAKTAVGIWRDLSLREASRDNPAAILARLGCTAARLPRGETFHDQARPLQLQPAMADPPPREVSTATETDRVCSEEAPSAPAMDAPVPDRAPKPTLDAAAIEQRYPLLRNAM